MQKWEQLRQQVVPRTTRVPPEQVIDALLEPVRAPDLSQGVRGHDLQVGIRVVEALADGVCVAYGRLAAAGQPVEGHVADVSRAVLQGTVQELCRALATVAATRGQCPQRFDRRESHRLVLVDEQCPDGLEARTAAAL